MDFHSLNRRELQSLCKLNKIPANITNIAMVDALKSLETVVGMEEIMNPSRSETAGSSIESPKEIEVTSPRAPRTSCRTSTRQKVKKPDAESLMTASSTSHGVRLSLKTPRKNDLTTTSGRNVESQLNECEEVAKNECSVDQEMKCIPNTPIAVPTTYSRRKGTTTSTRQDTLKKENTVQRVYSTRRSARLTEKKCAEPGVVNKERSQPVKIESFLEEASVTSEEDAGNPALDKSVGLDMHFHTKSKVDEICNVFKKLDVLVDGSDQSSTIKEALQANTTLESGEEKANGCVALDNLKVKSIEIIEQDENVDLEEKHIVGEKLLLNEVVNYEEISGQADNLKPESECISNLCEDGDSEEKLIVVDEKLCSVYLGLEEHLDSLLYDKILSETDGINIDANSSGTKNPSNPSGLGSSNMLEDLIHNNRNVAKEITAGPEGIEEHISINNVDGVLVNPNEEETKDFETLEEAQESLIKETAVEIMPPTIYQEIQETIFDADKVTHKSVADVSIIKEENQISTNANEVVDHPTHLTPIKNQTSSNRQTPIRGITDNNENIGRNLQEVIVEEDKIINRKSVDEKPMSLNETSIRQLKKQLKALSIKNNNTNTNKDIMVTEARPALQVVRDN